MDYQRTSLERLQRLDVNRTHQIKALARAARLLISTPHHSTLAAIMTELNQERAEIRYWIRVKTGRLNTHPERRPPDALQPKPRRP